VKVRTQLLSPLVALPRPVELDAITIDAYGTLLELHDPVGSLARLLPGHDRAAIERGFAAEAQLYVAESHRGHDAESLARLYGDCVSVFNEAAGSSLGAEEYLQALEAAYAVLPGVPEGLARLRALGLELAVVGNWDSRLGEHLERLGLAPFFSTVVSSGEVGAVKPDPGPFRVAVERLGVDPGRALHCGDTSLDEEGAGAAGVHFAPAPVSTLRERLA
jgi:HAD superfamily hydrolase (TIGR01549 family)